MAKAPTREELKAFVAKVAEGIKTQEDLNQFAADLLKITVESALNAELDHHLGYPKHSSKGKNTNNESQIHKAAPHRHKGFIGHPQLAGLGCFKLPVY